MPRLTAVSWKVLECIFLLAGFRFARQHGSHRTYIRPGCPRALVIPAHNRPVDTHVILSNLRSAGMDRAEYFRLLEQCR